MVGIGRRRIPRGEPAERSESGTVPGGEPVLPEHAPLRQPAPPVHRGAARCRGRRRPCRAGACAQRGATRRSGPCPRDQARGPGTPLGARRVRPRRLRRLARRAGGSAGSMGDLLRPQRAVRARVEELAGGVPPAVGQRRRRGSRTRSTNASRSTPGCSGASIVSSPMRRATCAGWPTCPSASTRPASTPGTGRSISPSGRPSACRPIGSTRPARTGACRRSRRTGFVAPATGPSSRPSGRSCGTRAGCAWTTSSGCFACGGSPAASNRRGARTSASGPMSCSRSSRSSRTAPRPWSSARTSARCRPASGPSSAGDACSRPGWPSSSATLPRATRGSHSPGWRRTTCRRLPGSGAEPILPTRPRPASRPTPGRWLAPTPGSSGPPA